MLCNDKDPFKISPSPLQRNDYCLFIAMDLYTQIRDLEQNYLFCFVWSDGWTTHDGIIPCSLQEYRAGWVCLFVLLCFCFFFPSALMPDYLADPIYLAPPAAWEQGQQMDNTFRQSTMLSLERVRKRQNPIPKTMPKVLTWCAHWCRTDCKKCEMHLTVAGTVVSFPYFKIIIPDAVIFRDGWVG